VQGPLISQRPFCFGRRYSEEAGANSQFGFSTSVFADISTENPLLFLEQLPTFSRR
jgi:hypothetical protein